MSYYPDSLFQLRTVIAGDHAMSTRLLLCQHAEQLESAIVLREMHSEYVASYGHQLES